jgi:hypothetical protein
MLSSMNNIAGTYCALSRVTKEVAGLYEKVREVQTRTLGEEHPKTLRSMNNLAETYRVLGRAKEAVSQ